jgi:LPXTG-motif cell wall-anchored protein
MAFNGWLIGLVLTALWAVIAFLGSGDFRVNAWLENVLLGAVMIGIAVFVVSRALRESSPRAPTNPFQPLTGRPRHQKWLLAIGAVFLALLLLLLVKRLSAVASGFGA